MAAADVVALPDRLSFEQGAAIPVNYATAWAALVRYGGLQAGERVLIHAAAGGVGIAATQIAKRYGAEVYGTASPGKHDAIRAQGVASPRYRARLGARAARSFDLSWTRSAAPRSAAPTTCCAPAAGWSRSAPRRCMQRREENLLTAARAALRMPRFNLIKQMSGVEVGDRAQHAAPVGATRARCRPWIDPLAELMEDGTIEPVVAEAVPFDRAAEAHRMIAERRNVGKVVLTP